MTRVLVADDRSEVREALRLLLEVETGAAVSEAANVHALFDGLRADCPDLLFVDWELPGLGRTLAGLRAAAPRTVIVATSGRPEARQAALAAGADGFICKSYPPDELLEFLTELAVNENGQAL